MDRDRLVCLKLRGFACMLRRKVVPVNFIQACTGSGGIDPHILNLGIIRRLVRLTPLRGVTAGLSRFGENMNLLFVSGVEPVAWLLY
jgi:hypothetical protein